MANFKLKVNRLRELLFYDRLSGIFRWKAREVTHSRLKIWNKRYAGTIAGRLDSDGYRQIAIDNVRYAAHKLAWFYITEEWPKELDHKNLGKDDNWFDNLRISTRIQNGCNRGVQKNNTSGYKGVIYYKKNKKWGASIKINKKNKFLGLFDTAEAAATARGVATLKYHGEFGRH